MRTIRFSKAFIPCAILSVCLILGGLVAYFLEGFNLGVDFQAGLIQEVQIAPTAFNITYDGSGNASVSLGRSGVNLVISGANVEQKTYPYPFDQYGTMGALAQGIQSVAGVHVQLLAAKDAPSNTLLQSAEASSTLGSSPYSFHYLPPGLNAVPIEEVRASLKSIGSVAVQSMGKPAERHFMIRVEDSQFTGDKGIETAKITQALETKFGEENVAVITANYVGSRFSKQLTDQAGLLMFLTMLLILVYVSFRFKPQFAIGAVLAIAHDALIMVAFITWTRMEFNTTQIAAILTILGYSINDTIVIFDRVREDLRIYPDDPFVLTMDRAISETLSRTIITTLTTMLAVFSLFFFTTGTMKDFALALLIGMTSGCYSTIFIACGFANFWQNHIKGRFGKKKASVAAVAA